MRFFHSLLRPEENAGRAMRCVHRLWVFLWLTAFGLGIGLLSLYLTANSYASIDAQALWESYFKLPLLVVMDLLLPLLVCEAMWSLGKTSMLRSTDTSAPMPAPR